LTEAARKDFAGVYLVDTSVPNERNLHIAFSNVHALEADRFRSFLGQCRILERPVSEFPQAEQEEADALAHFIENKHRELVHGNVFKDLGFVDADERKLKVQLAMRLHELIAEKGYTQAQLAEVLSIAQPHVSELVNYRLNPRGFPLCQGTRQTSLAPTTT
jgi:predicted XRE-type DNA-binding protein